MFDGATLRAGRAVTLPAQLRQGPPEPRPPEPPMASVTAMVTMPPLRAGRPCSAAVGQRMMPAADGAARRGERNHTTEKTGVIARLPDISYRR
ncbi:hypothetical protein SAZ_12275 [Streptomyces noursei ZPM]|nr:hypothetical protein SAZ_12275 [Streptomyces noursei ZPM]